MKNFNLLILLGVFLFIGCSDTDSFLIEEPESYILTDDSFLRLNLEDEKALEEAILSGEIPDDMMLKGSGSKKFISMLSTMPELKSTSGEDVSYYEELGFDTLVPNLNFAALLTPEGELEVGNEVIRITPAGTYKFSKEHEEEFYKFLEENPDFSIEDHIDYVFSPKSLKRARQEDFVIINDNITLYDTFSGGSSSSSSSSSSSTEPDFDSFKTFNADRKTVVGGLIQSVIGSKRDHTIEFNSKRRLRGCFYFYNYGVYSECGVTGETQKKNWIGWSGTECDELRVGWKNVKIEKSIDDYFAQTLKDLQDVVFYEPQLVRIDGKYVKVATLLVPPNYKPTVVGKLWREGVAPALKYVEGLYNDEYGSDFQKALKESEALIVASRTSLDFFTTRDVIKYNVKKYTHVFDKSWMDFQIGWSNTKGFFMNNINSNNYQKKTTYLKAVYGAFNSDRGELTQGEVYVCGRFGNTWRGMKIVKK
jgi:hypothetical protein